MKRRKKNYTCKAAPVLHSGLSKSCLLCISEHKQRQTFSLIYVQLPPNLSRSTDSVYDTFKGGLVNFNGI